jgi:integrase
MSIHAFRHTVILQRLRTLRMDPATVAEIAGNSAQTIDEHYDKNVSIEEQNHAQDQMDILARGKIKEARI